MTNTPPTIPNVTVHPGYLSALWIALNTRGYATRLQVPSTYSNALRAEVVRFQGQLGLVPDGIVGPRTWRALFDRGPEPAGPIPFLPFANMQQAIKAVKRHACLSIARSYLGKREEPLGSNLVPFLERRAQGKPWCDFFVHQVLKEVKGSWLFGGRRGSTRVSLRQAYKNGFLNHGMPCPGDVFTLLDDDHKAYHTGFVLRVGDDRYQTIEGNCNNRVTMRERPIDRQVAFWSPWEKCEYLEGLLPDVKRVDGLDREGTR